MGDRFGEALKILQAELGFSVLSVWAPGHEKDGNVEVLALFLAKDDDAMMAAAIDFATGNKVDS